MFSDVLYVFTIFWPSKALLDYSSYRSGTEYTLVDTPALLRLVLPRRHIDRLVYLTKLFGNASKTASLLAPTLCEEIYKPRLAAYQLHCSHHQDTQSACHSLIPYRNG